MRFATGLANNTHHAVAGNEMLKAQYLTSPRGTVTEIYATVNRKYNLISRYRDGYTAL